MYLKNRKITTIVHDLLSLVKILKHKNILGKFTFLIEYQKARSDTIKVTVKEFVVLWKKCNFPVINKQTITAKVLKLMEEDTKNSGGPKYDFEAVLEAVFDFNVETETQKCFIFTVSILS